MMKERFTAERNVYRVILHHPRTRSVKWLVASAIAYTLVPLLPVVGRLDDVVMVAVGICLTLKLIPKDIVEECRRRVHQSQ